jgi:2,4-dienoyl-CoA reductase-like NADH-dependent reductase (Old Yellow Enzyme family)
MTTAALFQPLDIAGVAIPNRVMQTAHSKLYSDRVESERETAYFVRRARGGCGLFIAGNQFVHPSASIRGFEDAFRPESVEADRRMTDAIRDAGARTFVQLNHHGAQAMPDGPDGPRPIYAPSRIISPSTGFATAEASAAEIRAFTDGWARSAELAREGGFDGIEVHMAHGYLLHQFLSPLYNARTDAYGGDLEGRTRFPREVLRAVRRAVGEDYPVGIRIVADEFHPDGLDAADMLEIIARLRAEHRIDFLDLAGGGYHNVHYVFPSAPMPAAWLRERVAGVKRAHPDVAVFGVGAARSVEEADEVITSGIADMVALTRAQLADPDLTIKLRDGREDGIRHCIRLNQGCLGRGSRGLPVSCTVNPRAGREAERDIAPPSAAGERWAVVGGGPAGMQAAVELARAGADVTLFEKTAELGGQLRIARGVPGRETVGSLVRDLERDLAAAGVAVRLETDADVELLRSGGYDAVAVATGAVAPARTTLALGGAYEGGMPRGTMDAFTALRDPHALGRRIAVVDGEGTAYASGIVLALLAAVDELELVTPFETVFPHVGAGYDRPILLERLGEHAGFRRHVAARVTGLDPLALRDVLTGETAALDGIDAVVAIEPRQSVRPGGLDAEALSAALEGRPVILVGDAVTPRRIDDAINDAVELVYARPLLPIAAQ